MYRGKKRASGPTWGCGYTAGTARIQYTGTSYARSVVGFFQPLLKERRDYSGIGEGNIFPVWTVRYGSHVDDPVEICLRHFFAPALFKSAVWLRWIQQGRIQLYIAYIVAAIVALLLVL
ncbi:MAG TPA: hypothetical protein DEB25_03285 [Desulfobulbaceae bacterium]|nr:hypothetical protein [Desulfobulbaceae bacterium]